MDAEGRANVSQMNKADVKFSQHYWFAHLFRGPKEIPAPAEILQNPTTNSKRVH